VRTASSRPTPFTALCFLLSLAIPATANATSDLVPNLIYRSWSTSQVGDYIVAERSEESAERAGTTRIRIELLALTPREAKLRTTISANDGSGWKKVSSEDASVAALISAEAGAKQRTMDGAIDEGDRTVDLLGRKVSAHWYRVRRSQLSGETRLRVETRTEVSDQVPSRIVGIDQAVFLPDDTLVYVSTTRIVDWSGAAAVPARLAP
jgi:hypothetical protein